MANRDNLAFNLEGLNQLNFEIIYGVVLAIADQLPADSSQVMTINARASYYDGLPVAKNTIMGSPENRLNFYIRGQVSNKDFTHFK